MNRPLIIRHYIKNRFILDLLSIISLLPQINTDDIVNNIFLIFINLVRLK